MTDGTRLGAFEQKFFVSALYSGACLHLPRLFCSLGLGGGA